MARPQISIVGAGRLAATIVPRLTAAGYKITEIVSADNPDSLVRTRRFARKMKAHACTAKSAKVDAGIIWFCVPDSKIAAAASVFVGRDLRGKVALHSSGVLGSDILAVLRKDGAAVASIHPLMTFVQDSQPDLRGVPFAIEGDASAVRVASRIAKDLGGSVVRIRKQDKVAYHAFATMICPLLLSLLAASEQTARLAGISAREAKRRMMPIVMQTLRNYERLGPAASFSGPIVRGDVNTVAQHLGVLGRRPALRDTYAALVKAALAYLPSQKKKAIARLLD